MAIAWDSSSASAAGTGNLSWDHTASDVAIRAVLVLVVQNSGATDEVTGVTYGGVAMSEVAVSPLLKATGETGAVYAYHLGSGIPDGSVARTVTVTVNGTGSSKRAVAMAALADDSQTHVEDSDTVSSDSDDNPTVTLSPGGVDALFAIGFHSGQDAATGITPATGWQSRLEHDFGSQTGGIYWKSTSAIVDTACGYTATAEDVAMIAVAIAEGAGGGGGGGFQAAWAARSTITIQPGLAG